jgi:hypothetical protein
MDIQYTYPDSAPKLAMQRSALDENVPCGDGVCFKSVLDVVNPLQQLPVVGSIYRNATGESISTFARLAGGALMGGPMGLAAAAVNAAIEMMTGNDLSGHLMAAAGGVFSPEKAANLYQNASKIGGTA